jgi:putative molybdopterin biosynthesis protein
LKRWLNQPAAKVQRGRDEFPVKLRFGLTARSAPLDALIATRRRMLDAERAAHHAVRERARASGDTGQWLVAEARVGQTEAALNALDSCTAIVRAPRAEAPESEAGQLVAIGSDDLVLDLLGQFLADSHPTIRFSAQRVGSLAGLMALREGRAQVAGIHLLDMDSGEYNVPFVKHLMPEDPMVLMQLAQREQGLMVATGNPQGIHGLKDLSRRGIRLINRQRGAGTRLFLFHQLRRAGVDPHGIVGFEQEAPTHNAVAAAIKAGSADVGPGIRAVAEAWGLEFIPLGHERYDLAIPRKIFDSPRLRTLREVIHATNFRQAAAALSGYDVSRMGRIVADIH